MWTNHQENPHFSSFNICSEPSTQLIKNETGITKKLNLCDHFFYVSDEHLEGETGADITLQEFMVKIALTLAFCTEAAAEIPVIFMFSSCSFWNTEIIHTWR